MKSEIDVEMQIIQTIQNLAPKQHTLEHVKGHQDDQISIEKLPWKAKLNVYCDFIATKELNKIISRQQTTIQLLPASRIKLDIDGTTITHHMPSQIRYRFSEKAIKQYMIKKHKWEVSTFLHVHIDIFHQLFQSFTKIQQRFYTRLLYRGLPLNQNQFKYNLSPTQQCPVCRLYREDELHFLHCTHPTYYEALHKIRNTTKICAIRNLVKMDKVELSLIREWL